jgi:hypothetical protein
MSKTTAMKKAEERGAQTRFPVLVIRLSAARYTVLDWWSYAHSSDFKENQVIAEF